MSDKVLKHPLVREYLHELDKASLTLPAAQARELREQIAAHLDEALPPDATHEQVRDEMGKGRPPPLPRRRRGRPGGPVAGHPGAGPAGPRPLVDLGPRCRAHRDRRLGPDLHAARAQRGPAGPGLSGQLVLPAGPGELGDDEAGSTPSTPSRTASASSRGSRSACATTATGPEVLGVAPHWLVFSLQPVQVAVGSGKWADFGSFTGSVRWSSPGSIPPHSARLLLAMDLRSLHGDRRGVFIRRGRAADRPRRRLHPDRGRTAAGLVRADRQQGIGRVPLAGAPR